MLQISTDSLNARLNQILIPVKVADVLDDGGFRFTAVNHALSDATGKSAEDYLGRKVTEVYPPHDAGVIAARFALVRDTAAPISFDKEHAFPIGKSWWRSTITPIVDTQGTVQRLCVSCLPINREVYTNRSASDEAQPTVTHAITNLDHTLSSIHRMGEALLMPGSQLAPDERRLVELIIRLAETADASLARIRQGGANAMVDVVEQALLAQGPVAELVSEVEAMAEDG